MARIDQSTNVDKAVSEALAALERHGTAATREGMARFGITAQKAFGVPMASIQALAKPYGRNQPLAMALWASGWYEARLMACYVGDPASITAAQMDLWCRSFENWADCDTACTVLFDRTPHAWKKVALWARRKDEFGKRAAFALLAGIALHDRKCPDTPFLAHLPLIEAAASDERNFVKKAVSWALRAIGRRNAALHAAVATVAARLAKSEDPTERWVGKDVARDLAKVALKLRHAEPRDIPALHALRLSVHENRLADPSRVVPAHYEPYIADTGSTWVAEDDEKILGFAVADRSARTIWALFVAPEAQGRGIGRALLARVTAFLAGSGAGPMFLSTDTNTRAEKLYLAAGWKKGGSLPNGEVRFERLPSSVDE